MKLYTLAALILTGSTLAVRAATINWTGGGDGVTWSDPMNWSGAAVPGSNDDAVLGPGGTVTISGNSYFVLSIQSQRAISFSGGSLYVSAGASEVKGPLTIAFGSILVVNGPGASFTCTNTVSADGAGLYVWNGGVLRLPGLTTYSKPDGYCSDAYLYSSGDGSVLDLSSVTNMYPGNCGYLRAQASSGGSIILSNIMAMTNGYFQASADGVGSMIDLGRLVTSPAQYGWFDLIAQNGGQIKMPLLSGGPYVGLTLRNGGVAETTQLKRIGGISVDNQTVVLPAVTNVDGAVSLYVYNGGYLSLPLVKSYSKTDGCYDVYWYAYGTGAVLDLSSITNVPYGGNNCGYIRAQAFSGGSVVLSNLLAVVTNTQFQAYADGAGSVLDLSKLSKFPDTTGWLDLQARNSGQVILPLLVDGSHVGISLANGGTMNLTQLKRIGGISVDNQTVVLPAVTNVDGAVSLYVYNGGYLSLPLVKSYSKTDGCYDLYWYAYGTGAVLDLSSITNVPYGGNNCGYIRAQAFSGGSVVLSNLVAVVTNTLLQAYAQDAGSVVDLSRFARFPDATGWLDLQARNGGQVIIPLLVDGSHAGITIIGNGVMNIVQLTRVNYVYVENAVVTLPAVTNMNSGTGLYAYYGAHLALPQLSSLTKTNGCYDTSWYAYGMGSLLDVSSVTNVIYSGDCGYLRMQAYYGAQIIASNLVSVPDGDLQAYSLSSDGQGTNSLIDLSRLSYFSTTNGWFDLEAQYGGTVLVSQLADARRAGLTIYGSVMNTANLTRLGGLTEYSSTNIFAALTNLDGASVEVHNGAVVKLPVLTSLTKTPGCYNQFWRAYDNASQIVAPLLASVASQDSCGSLNVEAHAGGSLILSNLISIAGPYVYVLADGGTIDLSRLNSYIAPNGQGSALTAQNGGVLLLGSQAFLLANVSVNIPPGNPLLPPVFIAGPNLSLYGQPWHSYLIEDRTTLVPDADWQFFKRVPQTNAFQVVGGPPPADTAFRVSELLANPAILELWPAPGQQFQILLYGLTSTSYHIETTTNFQDPASWMPYTSVSMTNTFRYFAPLSPLDGQRYFRARIF